MAMTLLPTCHPMACNMKPQIIMPGFVKGRYCQDNLDISLEGCIQMPHNTDNFERKLMHHRPPYFKIGTCKFSFNLFRDHITMIPEWTITILTKPHTL
jgi:hypothetical protein